MVQLVRTRSRRRNRIQTWRTLTNAPRTQFAFGVVVGAYVMNIVLFIKPIQLLRYHQIYAIYANIIKWDPSQITNFKGVKYNKR